MKPANKNNIYGKPISFVLRFDVEDDHIVYRRLADIVNNYVGKLRWIMHHEGSQINYTIEPYDFYTARKSGETVHKGVKEMMSDEKFRELVDLSLYDVNGLSIEICNKFDIGNT